MNFGSRVYLIADFVRSIKMYEIWGYFALDDMAARYKRTYLGPIWNAAYTIAMASAFALVFGVILGQPIEKILPRILAGFVVWQLCGAGAIDSATALINSAHTIRSTALPYFWYICRHLARTFLFFGHNLVLLVPILFYFGYGAALAQHAMLVPAVLLSMLALAPWSLAIAMLCARFRDIQYFITNFSQILYFWTPIMWDDSIQTASKRYVVDWNPFYYFLKLVQDPLLDHFSGLRIWGAVALIGLAGWGLMIPVFQIYRNRIAFWL